MSPERILPTTEKDKELVQQHVARYEFAKAYVKDLSVVDIACGTGYGSAILAQAQPRTLHGIDISPDAIHSARVHFSHPLIMFHEGNFELLLTLEPVDVIVSFETIEHLPDPAAFLATITRKMVRSGILIISTPVRHHGSLEDKPENPFHIREWTTEEFVRFLSGYFEHTEVFGQYFYRKMQFPGSRTIARTISSILYPVAGWEMKNFEVLKRAPALPGIPIQMGVIVVVCRDPKIR